MSRINVLDKDQIRLVDVMGSDLSVVNAARASFLKEVFKLTKPDIRLIQFLARDGHESPFRHGAARVRVVSTIRERLEVESLLGTNLAGFVFKPDLGEVIERAVGLDDRHEWRITASLAGFVRLGGFESLLAPHFPHSIEALTGHKYDGPIAEPVLREGERIDVLDKGYVRLIDWMWGDDNDERLVSFEIKAPLMVRSQWFKYRYRSEHTPLQFIPIPWEEEGTGNGDDGSFDPLYARNEASRRYVTLEPEFYIPEVWRSAPENKKQGSGGAVYTLLSDLATNTLRVYIRRGVEMYETFLSAGICAEQARLFLPAYAMYTTWRWTASLQSVCHFLNQRLENDAQVEIQEYAKAVEKLLDPVFPVAVRTWRKGRSV